MTKNKKNSVDFTFSFGAIEPKRKHRIERILVVVNSGKKNVYRIISFAIKFVMKSFNSKKLAKM